MRHARLIVLAVLASAAGARAQDTLVINHTTRGASLDRARVESGERLRIGGTLKVRIDSTNSAIYTCSVVRQEARGAESGSTTGFLAGLGSYVPELAFRIDRTVRARGGDNTRQRALEEALAVVEDIMLGRDGLRAAFVRTVATLDVMREQVALDSAVAEEYRVEIASFCDDAERCRKLAATRRLAIALGLLTEATAEFKSAVENRGSAEPPPTAYENRLLMAAAHALAKADELMSFAYGTERLVYRAYNASRVIHCEDDVTVKTTRAFNASITVAAAALPGVQRAATNAPYQLSVEVLRDWLIRPAVGLSFLVAPEAKHPRHAAKKLPDGTFEVIENGSTDTRFTSGLTMAITWRFLDWRDRWQAAVYFPELTANPSEDVKVVAIGTGISWRALKLGIGYAWTKHTFLSRGQQVGDILSDAAELSISEGYGRRKPYVSVSLIGVPGFSP